MLEVIAIIAIVLAIAIAVILILAATKPDTFRVQRATTIKAPPKKSFPSSTTFVSGEAGRLMKTRTPR
jgi:FlaG/FlaF family flagellin (archaellin)